MEYWKSVLSKHIDFVQSLMDSSVEDDDQMVECTVTGLNDGLIEMNTGM